LDKQPNWRDRAPGLRRSVLGKMSIYEGVSVRRTTKNQKGFVDNAVGIKHRNLRDRILAFEHYGGLKCACCLETEFSFLSLDHIDGEGNTHRRKLLGNKFFAGHHIYRKLRELNFPKGFQVLCMNCQVGRRDNGGICPHKRKALTGPELLKEFDKLRVGRGNTEAMHNEEYKGALASIMRKAVQISSIEVSTEGETMPNQVFNNFDLVGVEGREGVWTVVEERAPLFYVQLGTDAGTRELLRGEALTLIEKVRIIDDDGPRLIPSTSIMGG